jgi:hypothetical protein
MTRAEPRTAWQRFWLLFLGLVPAAAAGTVTGLYYRATGAILPTLLVAVVAFAVSALAAAVTKRLTDSVLPTRSPAHRR